ncbi:hypothetical protein CERSUDRAFT_113437 [Gelatoporia subvermispora B]|uniref:Uncharacterized protein n=1 Tax=Ceriporiopsis subvermispora (strain B) TaxID=914234 RepID=M2QMJ8_CERS8|nr:hypothetical protein CERSUDRAFT_113437 [Gelatoporia subvermispora B]
MCYFLIEYAVYNCTHQYPLQKHWVACNRQACTLSRNHQRTQHDCLRTCQQQALPDVDLVLPGNSHPVPCNPCLNLPAVPGNGASALYIHHNGYISEAGDSDTASESESGSEVESVSESGEESEA